MLKFAQRNHRAITRIPNTPAACINFSTSASLKNSYEKELDFTNAKTVYASKSVKEIIRALVVLRISGITPLVANAITLLDVAEKVFGKSFVKSIMRMTFFGHFCAGEDQEGIRPTVKKLENVGVGSILDYAAEADENAPIVDERLEGVVSSKNVARVYLYEGEESCDEHVEIFQHCIRAVHKVSPTGFAAIKLTALCPPDLLKRMSTALIEIRDLFDKFDKDNSGVISIKEFEEGYRNFWSEKLLTGELTLENLRKKLDKNGDGTIDYIEWTNTLKLEHLPLLLHEEGNLLTEKALTEDEIEATKAFARRVDEIAKLASEKDVRLMIDAEQTYFQPAIDNIVYGLMDKYNRNGKYTIFSTYQCYLKDTAQRLTTDVERANRMQCNFGAKLVRGAYLVSERERASSMSYEDPCHPNIEETHKCYHQCVDILINKIFKAEAFQEGDLSKLVQPIYEGSHGVEFMVASHNQDSVEYTIRKMKELGVSKESVYFGQLLGMSDHLTMTLGASGYLAYKYVPYGPVEEVIPYLLRRAQENSGMLSGAKHEIKMLQSELFRRVNPFAK